MKNHLKTSLTYLVIVVNLIINFIFLFILLFVINNSTRRNTVNKNCVRLPEEFIVRSFEDMYNSCSEINPRYDIAIKKMKTWFKKKRIIIIRKSHGKAGY